jgi:hypothetical protein
MPRVGFEPTIPVFKRAKTVQALDRATTVIGDSSTTGLKKEERLFHVSLFSPRAQSAR